MPDYVSVCEQNLSEAVALQAEIFRECCPSEICADACSKRTLEPIRTVMSFKSIIMQRLIAQRFRQRNLKVPASQKKSAAARQTNLGKGR